MRAAILGLSALIVLLSVSIVVQIHKRQGEPRTGTRLDVAMMINDAAPGEQAVYREVRGLGRFLTYKVTNVWTASVKRVPVKEIEVTLRDPRQPPESADRVRYEHRITDHFWFPLMEPRAPDEKDRVWILRSIRRDEILLGNRSRECWRMDLIDPALPPDQEHVVAWVDETVPVFGLLKWTRRDQTFELDSATEGGR